MHSADCSTWAHLNGPALALAQVGYADQVSLGHDASPFYCFGPRDPAVDISACWLPIPQIEVPWLRANGATADQIEAMTIRSVASTFEAAAAMAR